MSSDDGVVDGVIVTELNLDPLAKGWKHFRENQLLVPNRGVAMLLHTRFPLKKKIHNVSLI